MAASYSTREVARLAKLPEGRVRSCAREGLLESVRRGRELTFGFRDLKVLRTVSSLVGAGVPFARVARAMRGLRAQLPEATPLSSAHIFFRDGRILASDGARLWDAETGQYGLPLDGTRRSAAVEPIAVGVEEERQAPAAWTRVLAGGPDAPTTANGWFDLALGLEESEPQAAYDAYLQCLASDPEHVEAHLNIGRLCSAAGELERAAAYFRQGMRIDPTHPIAHFNLGVTLHDLGDVHGAIVAYRTALLHDPSFADAHYNLAALLEQQGDLQGAVKHMNAYRVASQERDR